MAHCEDAQWPPPALGRGHPHPIEDERMCRTLDGDKQSLVCRGTPTGNYNVITNCAGDDNNSYFDGYDDEDVVDDDCDHYDYYYCSCCC